MQLARTRTLGLALAAVLALPALADAQPLPTAKQVIDRYIEAVGGRQALANRQFRHTVAEMDMPSAGMRMTIETFQARPNRLFVKSEIPGMGAMAYGFDGTVAWMNNPMQGPSLTEGKELEQRQREADFDSSINYEKYFPTMETVERTEMGGRACYKLRLVTAGGDEIFQCFDVENGLLVGSTAKQASQMGEIEVVTLFTDYQDHGGLKLPMKMTSTMMGQQMNVTMKSVSFEPFDPSVFELPAEIRALKQPRN
ncbi:MAG TPA: hypothetical protein VFX98_01565 [Longimicrobiaceae bacterium]|nr:hypothetical protein [Longimicrobiaceae bacterium]